MPDGLSARPRRPSHFHSQETAPLTPPRGAVRDDPPGEGAGRGAPARRAAPGQPAGAAERSRPPTVSLARAGAGPCPPFGPQARTAEPHPRPRALWRAFAPFGTFYAGQRRCRTRRRAECRRPSQARGARRDLAAEPDGPQEGYWDGDDAGQFTGLVYPAREGNPSAEAAAGRADAGHGTHPGRGLRSSSRRGRQ